MDQQDPIEWQARSLPSWHLGTLRFTLMRDNADRLGVLAIANEIDRLGSRGIERPDFDFLPSDQHGAGRGYSPAEQGWRSDAAAALPHAN
jgi:hypothetical protein